jgi:hypothetical protein
MEWFTCEAAKQIFEGIRNFPPSRCGLILGWIIALKGRISDALGEKWGEEETEKRIEMATELPNQP